MIWFLAYCAGFTLTTGVIFGANAYARVLGRDEPFDWEGEGWNGDDKAVIRNLSAMFAWPVSWLVWGSNKLVRRAARGVKRRQELAEERQRLLESPIED